VWSGRSDKCIRYRRQAQQERSLRLKEAKLQQLAQGKNKQEFFNEFVPLLKPLQFYIRRRLRIAYLTQQITRPLATSGDMLDRVILNAYENYSHKPEDLALEPWLYQVANRELQRYLSNEQSGEKRNASFKGYRARNLVPWKKCRLPPT
jgi:hypothetical protein